ncbi:MAG: ETC complex I subunit [Proteobacteria bacterium]|nr:ETC complex I subunit [Pseudomonadota bacterium]MBI3495927.1 ETC complex I subunit [Pseudomonadota bacterium]
MSVRIYQPSKTAMQSGRAKTHKWVMEFEPESRRGPEPLMGWTASADTRQQVHLEFDTREEAVAYAEKHGYPYTLVAGHDRRLRPKAYADNFRFDRSKAWTH